MDISTINAFFDELAKIGQQGREGSASPPMDIPKIQKNLGAMPMAPPPSMKAPRPPVAERIKSLARRGGAALKGIESVVMAPQKPHRFLGTAYRKDFSGFKYS